MSLKKWFGKIKNATQNHVEKRKSKGIFNDAKSRVVLPVFIDECHNWDMDKKLGIDYCEVRYCPSNWRGELMENDPNAIVHQCQRFNGEKCSHDCPKMADNNAFFDARDAFNAARKKHINSIKTVFGLRVK